jgi:hypothetical protein
MNIFLEQVYFVKFILYSAVVTVVLDPWLERWQKKEYSCIVVFTGYCVVGGREKMEKSWDA